MTLYRTMIFAVLLVVLFSFSSVSGRCHHDHDDCGDSASSSAFVLMPELAWLDNGPLDKLIKKEGSLKDLSFNLQKRNANFMLGIGGIHDHGNGFRTGFSLHAGYKSFVSETFTGGISRVLRDSVALLRVIPAYGGFTFDKAYHFYDMTLSFGTMLGGGVSILNREFYDVEESGAFTTTIKDTSEDDEVTVGDWAFAPMFTFDLHAGVAFGLSPLLHLGIEAVALCCYSPEGYGYATGEFFTINPGLRLRLSVGKAG
jgi:hypothetical protein